MDEGYDYEFISTVPDEYVCKLCHLVLRKPVQTKCCGHRFCKECLQEANESEQIKCPVDGDALDIQQDVFDDKGAERTINSLLVTCPSDGCEWQGELMQVEAHEQTCGHKVIGCSNEGCKARKPRMEMTIHFLQDCEWREVPCPHCEQTTKFCELEAHEKICHHVTVKCTNSECDVMIPRMEMANHLEQECEWRRVPCPHCSAGYMVLDLQDHIKVCSKTPARCPNGCGLLTTNAEISDHVTNECPLTEVPCIYQRFGCQFSVQRNDNKMDKHMEKAMKDHLAFTCESLKLLQEQNDVLSDRVSLLEDENESLSCRLVSIQDESMSKFDQLFSKISLLEDQNMFMSARLNVVQDENESMSRQISSLQGENESMSQRISSLQGENESMSRPISSLQGENESMSRRISSLHDKNESVSRQDPHLQDEKALANSKQASLQDENKKKQKKDLAEKVEQCIPCMSNFVWKIDKVKKILQDAKEGKATLLYSEPFYTANPGYKLRLMLFPNGDRKANAGHMSIYPQILRGKYDDMSPWPFKKDITITLVDQKTKIKNRKNVKNTVCSKSALDRYPQCFQKPTSDFNTGMPGLLTFVTHEKLMSKSYVKENSIIIIVDVSEAKK